MALFTSIQSTGKHFPTVFCDVSGSVIGNKFNAGDVLKCMCAKMMDQFQKDGVKAFKVVWFGSPNVHSPLGLNGYVIDYSTYFVSDATTFEEVARSNAHRNNLTCPHYALDGFIKSYHTEDSLSIKPLHTWMNPTVPDAVRSVYFLCDGELFDGTMNTANVSASFGSSMKRFMDIFPHHRFTILAVDIKVTATSSESTVGCDIYKALSDTKRINLFRTFTLSTPEGIDMFENRYVPPTHISYGDRMFLRSDEPQFYNFIQDEVLRLHDDSIASVVRKTCMALTDFIDKEGMTTNQIKQLIHVYSKLFERFVPDADCFTTVEQLTDSFKIQMEKNMRGDALLASEVRKTLEQKFTDANESLRKDARSAFGSDGNGLGTSFLFTNKIYLVPMRSTTHPFKIYNKAGFQDKNGTVAPIMPLLSSTTEFSEQCIRQFTRGIMEKHGVECRSEQSKFAFLIEMLCVVRSDVPEHVATWWRRWARIMLEKKLPGKDVREIDHFRQGNVLNLRDVEVACSKVLGRAIPPSALWYGICKEIGKVSGDDILCTNQMFKDTAELERALTTLPKVSVVEIEDEFEFECPIVGNITSGFVFPEHKWRNMTCSPKVVLSEEGLNGMTNPVGIVKCIYCRGDVPRSALTRVTKSDCADTFPVVTPVEESVIKVIQLVGVPGSGKTTTRQLLVKELQTKHPNWNIHIVSVDDECLKLIRERRATARNAIGMAVENVNSYVTKCLQLPGVNVLIADTCGDFKGKFFGQTLKTIPVRFESNVYASINWDDYAGGTLYKILMRDNTNDFLNPVDGGAGLCMDVHKKKMNALYPNKYKINPPKTLEEAKVYLTPYHDRYMTYLTENDALARVSALVSSM